VTDLVRRYPWTLYYCGAVSVLIGWQQTLEAMSP